MAGGGYRDDEDVFRYKRKGANFEAITAWQIRAADSAIRMALGKKSSAPKVSWRPKMKECLAQETLAKKIAGRGCYASVMEAIRITTEMAAEYVSRVSADPQDLLDGEHLK